MSESRASLPRDVVLTAIVAMLAATVSAGIHAGLAPEHLGEVPLLGISFVLATVALLAVAAAVTIRPRAPLPASLAALLFAGLILAYVASRTTGLPVLEPEPEAADAIGIVTVAIQSAGLLAALRLTSAAGGPAGGPEPLPHRARVLTLAVVVAIAFAAVALGAAGDGHEHGDAQHGIHEFRIKG
jgi:hypothetical protein